MAENTSNTSVSQSSSQPGSSAPVSTVDSVTGESAKTPSKEDVVKSLVEQGSKKYQDKAPTKVEKQQQRPATEIQRVEKASTEEKKETAKPEDDSIKPDEKLDPGKDKSEPAKADIDGDPILAKRIAAIAKAEEKNRLEAENVANAKKELESHKSKVEGWDKFTSTFVNDPVKALQDLGLEQKHLDALYWRLNDEAKKQLADGSKPLTQEDVERRAREIFAEEQKKNQEKNTEVSQQQFNQAMDEAHKGYFSRVGQVFEASKDKFPAVAAWGITASDIRSYTEKVYGDTRKLPTYEETLNHFESEYQSRIEAAGYKKPTVEAPKPAEQKPIQSSKTVTAGWQAGSTPTGDKEKSPSQSLKESREEIKRKLDQGFFKKRAS